MCLLTETRALSAQGEKRALVGNLTMPGLGYAVSSAVRLEAIVTYRPRFTFDGRANFLDPDRRQSASADLAALAGILAAYVDLPGLGCVRSARSPSAPKESPGRCRITASRKNPPT